MVSTRVAGIPCDNKWRATHRSTMLQSGCAKRSAISTLVNALVANGARRLSGHAVTLTLAGVTATGDFVVESAGGELVIGASQLSVSAGPAQVTNAEVLLRGAFSGSRCERPSSSASINRRTSG